MRNITPSHACPTHSIPSSHSPIHPPTLAHSPKRRELVKDARRKHADRVAGQGEAPGHETRRQSALTHSTRARKHMDTAHIGHTCSHTLPPLLPWPHTPSHPRSLTHESDVSSSKMPAGSTLIALPNRKRPLGTRRRRSQHSHTAPAHAPTLSASTPPLAPYTLPPLLPHSLKRREPVKDARRQHADRVDRPAHARCMHQRAHACAPCTCPMHVPHAHARVRRASLSLSLCICAHHARVCACACAFTAVYNTRSRVWTLKVQVLGLRVCARFCIQNISA